MCIVAEAMGGAKIGFCGKAEFRPELSKQGVWFPERTESVFREDGTQRSQRKEGGAPKHMQRRK